MDEGLKALSEWGKSLEAVINALRSKNVVCINAGGTTLIWDGTDLSGIGERLIHYGITQETLYDCYKKCSNDIAVYTKSL